MGNLAYRNSNEAYDFALFEPKRQQEAPQRKNNIIEIPKKKLEENRKPRTNPLKAVSGFLALAVMLGMVGSMVYGQVQLTELTDQLNTNTKILNEEQSVYTQLKMKSDSQLSLETVENYATQKLGMQKIQQNQIEPIELSKGDRTKVVKAADGQDPLTSLWETILEMLS
jgi:cell division protein FtsL